MLFLRIFEKEDDPGIKHDQPQTYFWTIIHKQTLFLSNGNQGIVYI